MKIGKRDKHQREPSSYDYGTGLHLNSKRLRCNLKMELRLKKFHRTLFKPPKDMKKKRKNLENQECFRGALKRKIILPLKIDNLAPNLFVRLPTPKIAPTF